MPVSFFLIFGMFSKYEAYFVADKACRKNRYVINSGSFIGSIRCLLQYRRTAFVTDSGTIVFSLPSRRFINSLNWNKKIEKG